MCSRCCSLELFESEGLKRLGYSKTQGQTWCCCFGQTHSKRRRKLKAFNNGMAPPDTDVDFCHVVREELIKHAQPRHTPANVAQIPTFGVSAIKAAGGRLRIKFETLATQAQLCRCVRALELPTQCWQHIVQR